MTRSTNLALRPFRNERLPWLLAWLLLTMAVGVSIFHARFINQRLSGEEAETVRRVREDEARILALEEEIARQPPLKIEPAEMSRIRAFKDLVDRRVFPWRKLLGELEVTLPASVRLTAIIPTFQSDSKGLLIALRGRAGTTAAAFSLAEALEAAPSFSRVVLKTLTEAGGEVEFSLDAEFEPVPRDAPTSIPPLVPEPVSGGTP